MERKYKGGYATCQVCDKALYKSRKEAKRWARVRHPGVSGLNAYYCPFGDGWHYGNLPPGGREQAKRQREAKARKQGQ